jgi:glycosyltransferase involved in cell wall biosynthesis
MIPEIVENGVNGFISNDEKELKQYVVNLLNDEGLAKEIGENARKTVVEKFSQEDFIKKWDSTFKKTAQKCFRG